MLNHSPRNRKEYNMRLRETTSSPLEGMDPTFRSYLTVQKQRSARHMLGNGIPDYAYGMDFKLRKKLDSIPGFYKISKNLTVTHASQTLQLMNQNAVCATPTNFPDVYEIGCECARRLGIPIPNIYIFNDVTLNAYTVSSDEVEPVIVIHSGLYERVTKGELKACIGHECGHIQNYHGTYDYVGTILAHQGAAALGAFSQLISSVLTQGVQLALLSWSRAAEVTADRAGLICADSPEDCHSLNAKLLYGGAFGTQGVDYKAIEEQLEMQMEHFSKYAELFSTHPTAARRIMVEREFTQCRVFYDWRPDLKKPDSIMRSLEECDERCKKYIDLTQKGR